MQNRPIIALIGRPNVGKSTLFNRLIGRRQAITSAMPGTTRDRHFGVMKWFGQSWTVIDTAGILMEEDEHELEQHQLQEAMEEQVDVAIEEASLVALVVDVKEGLHPIERTLLNILRKHQKPVVLLGNKSDNQAIATQAEAFRELGIETIFPVSAIHGSGVGVFVDWLMDHYPSPAEAEEAQRLPRVTIIGRPNVGKSTLINQIIGDERMIVSDVPGTTRDSIASEVALDEDTHFVFVDTAGIRRRGRIEQGIEKYSLFRTLRAINQSDIVIQVLTIEEAPTRGDAHVAMYAQEAGKKLILVLNKTDLAVQKIAKLTPNERRRLGEKFLKRFPFLQRLPLYFTSAETGEGVKDLLEALKKMIQEQASSQEKQERPSEE